MNDLAKYIKATKTRQNDLASRVGVSAPFMCGLVAGNRSPSLSVAFTIERATGGAVKAASWVSEIITPDQGGAA